MVICVILNADTRWIWLGRELKQRECLLKSKIEFDLGEKTKKLVSKGFNVNKFPSDDAARSQNSLITQLQRLFSDEVTAEILVSLSAFFRIWMETEWRQT